MKLIVKIILIIFILIFISLNTFTDDFQLYQSNYRMYISFSPVYINNALIGYTNKYGIIRITMDPGRYNGHIEFAGKRYNIIITITNSNNLVRINIE